MTPEQIKELREHLGCVGMSVFLEDYTAKDQLKTVYECLDEIERLHRVIQDYAMHSRDCMGWAGEKCVCGFSDAIKGQKKMNKEGSQVMFTETKKTGGSMFIELTSTFNTARLLVNIGCVHLIEQCDSGGCTLCYEEGSSFDVIESLEDIKKLISGAGDE